MSVRVWQTSSAFAKSVPIATIVPCAETNAQQYTKLQCSLQSGQTGIPKISYQSNSDSTSCRKASRNRSTISVTSSSPTPIVFYLRHLSSSLPPRLFLSLLPPARQARLRNLIWPPCEPHHLSRLPSVLNASMLNFPYAYQLFAASCVRVHAASTRAVRVTGSCPIAKASGIRRASTPSFNAEVEVSVVPKNFCQAIIFNH